MTEILAHVRVLVPTWVPVPTSELELARGVLVVWAAVAAGAVAEALAVTALSWGCLKHWLF